IGDPAPRSLAHIFISEVAFPVEQVGITCSVCRYCVYAEFFYSDLILAALADAEGKRNRMNVAGADRFVRKRRKRVRRVDCWRLKKLDDVVGIGADSWNVSSVVDDADEFREGL